MIIQTGSEIGNYKILSKIGSGGMGDVFLAEDTRLARRVAIKFLNQDLGKDAEKLSRFVQEAKTTSALTHPNILTVFEIGDFNGKPFIATEFIDGDTLRDRLSKEPLELGAALDITLQITAALAAAHEAGVIHRDIKPENIMIRKDGLLKGPGLWSCKTRPDFDRKHSNNGSSIRYPFRDNRGYRRLHVPRAGQGSQNRQPQRYF